MWTTNAIESANARIRQAVRARGQFPNEQAALKCILSRRDSFRPQRKGPSPMDTTMESALNDFDITFDGRLSAHSH